MRAGLGDLLPMTGLWQAERCFGLPAGSEGHTVRRPPAASQPHVSGHTHQDVIVKKWEMTGVGVWTGACCRCGWEMVGPLSEVVGWPLRRVNRVTASCSWEAWSALRSASAGGGAQPAACVRLGHGAPGTEAARSVVPCRRSVQSRQVRRDREQSGCYQGLREWRVRVPFEAVDMLWTWTLHHIVKVLSATELFI